MGQQRKKKRIIGPSTRFWADDMKGTFWPYVAMLGLAVICPIDENRRFLKNIYSIKIDIFGRSSPINVFQSKKVSYWFSDRGATRIF